MTAAPLTPQQTWKNVDKTDPMSGERSFHAVMYMPPAEDGDRLVATATCDEEDGSIWAASYAAFVRIPSDSTLRRHSGSV